MDTMDIFPHDESCLEVSGSSTLANSHAKKLCLLVQMILSDVFFPYFVPLEFQAAEPKQTTGLRAE